jgi:hypothetical protein
MTITGSAETFSFSRISMYFRRIKSTNGIVKIIGEPASEESSVKHQNE